jgi:hypothetical protein
MALSVFPATSVKTAPNAYSVTMPLADTLYESPMSLSTGVYTCTCVSTTITYIDFIDSAGEIHKQVQTLNGLIVTAISSSISKVRVSTDTGTNIVVSLELTANPEGATVAPTLGTLETLTTTGTYTSTSTSGFALAVAVGGGAGGSNPASNNAYGGGGSGGVAAGIVVLNGSRSYTIGAQGNAGAPGNTGGTTTIGNVSATGGVGAVGGSGGAGGTPRGGSGGNTGSPGGFMPQGGETTRHPYQFVKTGTTSGGAGARGGDSTSPTGSGIGQGAAGNTGWAASGFGGGGGAGGGNGTAGVIYLKRF